MGYLMDPRQTGPEEPLPWVITMDNKWRWDEYKAMAQYNIYKFRHEAAALNRRTDVPRRKGVPDVPVFHHPHDWPETELVDIFVEEKLKEGGSANNSPRMMAAMATMMTSTTPTSPYWRWREFATLVQEYEERQPDP